LRRNIEELHRIKRMLSSMGVDEIARRMFVTNSFDSLITAIGIVLGNFIFGTSSPHSYLGSALGGSLTMGIFSSFLGVYVTEKAERLRELREIEEQLLAEVKNSIYGEVARLAPLYVALWSMSGSTAFTLAALSPFILSIRGLLDLSSAIAASVAISNAIIAGLGAYMGKISGEGSLKGMMKFALLSLSATAILIFFSMLGI